jgi:phosphoribosylamine--glycine ligase
LGPEQPLVNGIHDYFENNSRLKSVTVIGPKKEGAILEGSKDFAKSFMKKHKIPTAKSKSFNNSQIKEAIAFLEEKQGPYVLKADGLAAGKGVVIESDLKQSQESC